MKVITVTNRKGGTAKTETARTLAAAFSLLGYSVLMIDTDAQGSLTLTTGAKLKEPNIYTYLEGKNDLKTAIQSTKQGDIIAADTSLYAIQPGSPYAFSKGLKYLKGYDIVIFDTPSCLSPLTVAEMTSSDGLIITTQADIHAFPALKEIKEEVEIVKEYNPKLKILGVVLTRFNNCRISKDIQASLKEVCKMVDTKLYDTAIRECNALRESGANGKSIFDHAKKSNAAADYMALAVEVLKDIGLTPGKE